jgi:hypothetical protein
MRKYSMLIGGLLLITSSIYGIFVSTFFHPLAPAVLASSLIVVLLVTYIELNKRRVLVDGRTRESFTLFIMAICCQIYFAIMAFTLLVYLNEKQKGDANPRLRLTGFIVGSDNLSIAKSAEVTLPYYFANFFLFIFYLRCYYIMFWK